VIEDTTMDPTQRQAPIDREPAIATCDVCGHEHACYVGGAPLRADHDVTRWQVHACLGCLMRARTPHAVDTCTDGSAPSTTAGRVQHA
jgi:hypothetical protein